MPGVDVRQPAADPGDERVEQVVAEARSADPGLPEELARELAVVAGEHLGAEPGLDAPEVARRLMAEVPGVGATPAAVTARAAVDVHRRLRP